MFLFEKKVPTFCLLIFAFCLLISLWLRSLALFLDALIFEPLRFGKFARSILTASALLISAGKLNPRLDVGVQRNARRHLGSFTKSLASGRHMVYM